MLNAGQVTERLQRTGVVGGSGGGGGGGFGCLSAVDRSENK